MKLVNITINDKMIKLLNVSKNEMQYPEQMSQLSNPKHKFSNIHILNEQVFELDLN